VTDLLIDGTLVAGGSGTFATMNPATEQPIGTAADADTTQPEPGR
jgi:aldehyde dehydrogenase (NAD+)